MILTNQKLSKPPTFNINSKPLDHVNEYTYLGIKIISTGNFSTHLKLIREKALHALFSISRKIDLKKLKPSLAGKIFDTFVSPILTYASLIWNLYSKTTFENWDKNDTEKVHLRFCRYFLGVSNKSSNIACRAELGLFPMKVIIDKLTIKYFNQLITLPENSVAKQCLLLSETLAKNGKPNCYMSHIKKMIHYYDPHQTVSINHVLENTTIRELESTMKTKYFEIWKNLLHLSPKLSFYETFKT